MKRIIIKTIHILSILCLCSEVFVANNLLHAERFCFEINSNNSFWDSQNKLFKSKGNSNDEVFSIAFLQDGTSLFYGNTDLFDSAREGYTPGYFVVKMNNLKIENENIIQTKLLVNNQTTIKRSIWIIGFIILILNGLCVFRLWIL